VFEPLPASLAVLPESAFLLLEQPATNAIVSTIPTASNFLFAMIQS
jgi:hypothetical protein